MTGPTMSARAISGPARVDSRVDRLLRRTVPGDVVVLDQRGIDDRLAIELVRCRPAAVVNVQSSTDDVSTWGALQLLRAGVHILDDVGDRAREAIDEGDLVTVAGANLLSGDLRIATGTRRSRSDINGDLAIRRSTDGEAFVEFAREALQFIEQEGSFLGGGIAAGADFDLRGRNVVVVNDGRRGQSDLRRLGRTTLAGLDAFLIAVGTGADALIARGYSPDLVVGPADSISQVARHSGATLLMHVEQGRERAGAVSAPCSTVDLAVLIAHEAHARMIVLVGAPTDVLGEDRMDPASAAVRAFAGPAVVDVETIVALRRSGVRPRDLALLVASAMFVLVVLAIVSEPIRLLVRGFWLTIQP